MSLRLKLLLVTGVLLVVPLVGYRYVIAMEQFLREHQSQTALESARTLALALAGQPELLAIPPHPGRDTLFVHPIEHSLQVDGYDDDWASLAVTPHPSTINLRAASDGQALFILLKLQVSRPNHAAPQLRLVLEDSPAFRRAWLLDASVPGAILVREVPPAAGLTGPAHADTRIRAAAQHRAEDLIYEIRIPLSIGITALSFEILGDRKSAHGTRPPSADLSEATGYREITARIPRRDVLYVRFAPRELSALLLSWAPTAGRRLRVIDTEARVLAQAGDVAGAALQSVFSRALEHFIDPHNDLLLSLTPVTLKLAGAEVDSSLAGVPAVRVRRIDTDGPLVVSAAYPLRDGNKLLGALILEESTSPAQALARHALLELLLAAGVAFLLGASVLLGVSARIVSRLRVFRDQAAEAVDDSGRVLKAFRAPVEADEIGDLGRSFGAAVSRLQAYQDYLEKLAQRLSHELRTPLTVIRSSLDNLSMTGADEESGVYIGRAQHGVERLESIVRRMSEAARLEQAIADNDRRVLDLDKLVTALVPAYQQSWPDWQFELRKPRETCPFYGSADLIVQALDKLLSNARDFADPDTTISIELSSAEHDNVHDVQIAVCNTGARLPTGDSAQLFESMNSQRLGANEDSSEAHLGFGLYVVRLVAEFHGGRAFAHDDPGTRRVCIGLRLPRNLPS